ncbi:hypothetical protein [Pseudobacteroides cellulosolvens]|uniref:Uncharacterized protein n=1 Tax=Pseudobacteroides cellulosolvens ATCC 35603 = DSM 2933 TaxID=398512 RepID=A0A0L6JKP7_9FIRM|nr:hypothetical protein [Pseudobacteroides cellulosolvens]KNY26330.1 hypothetical protein Bccel_1592 [Pseudobacteroides cellulosolvens ATCC 35603 = DSM 2933]
MSVARTTEILENINKGWTSVLITATAAETKTVKTSAGKVAKILVNGNYNVTLNDDTTAKWAAINNTSVDFSNCPIKCDTSIKLTFSGAGSAWIVYK